MATRWRSARTAAERKLLDDMARLDGYEKTARLQTMILAQAYQIGDLPYEDGQARDDLPSPDTSWMRGPRRKRRRAR